MLFTFNSLLDHKLVYFNLNDAKNLILKKIFGFPSHMDKIEHEIIYFFLHFCFCAEKYTLKQCYSTYYRLKSKFDNLRICSLMLLNEYQHYPTEKFNISYKFDQKDC